MARKEPWVSALRWTNVVLRALMELGLVSAFVCWGLETGRGMAEKWFLALGAPTAVFGFWGAVDFRNAGRWAEPLRLTQELALTGLAAWVWYACGFQAWGWALAALSLVHHVLVYALGGTLLKR